MAVDEKDTEEIMRKLQERVKELNTLYRISKIMAMRDEPLETSLKRITDILPQGWQHPDVCCSRISYGNIIVTSPRFKEGRWNQKEDILLDGKSIGTVEIHYVSKRPDADEGPFLLEERNLIIEVSWRIAELISIRKNEMHQRAKDEYMYFLNEANEMIAMLQLSPQPKEDVIRLVNDSLCKTVGCSHTRLAGMPATSIFGKQQYVTFRDEFKDNNSACMRKHLTITAFDGSTHTVCADIHRITLSNKEHIFLTMKNSPQ